MSIKKEKEAVQIDILKSSMDPDATVEDVNYIPSNLEILSGNT